MSYRPEATYPSLAALSKRLGTARHTTSLKIVCRINNSSHNPAFPDKDNSNNLRCSVGAKPGENVQTYEEERHGCFVEPVEWIAKGVFGKKPWYRLVNIK
ncbi:hypothetical protein N656DRAFT_784886 [Canariomyces notabilis]|uniref:Uncharacterized protein n=1 Tax=Canariomyces notabilis TaxID=2074819 RepID=A0AAN6QE32_9PEZI|nr:hypothetical protein N656DRAFT_784886 [Canariomyces arenarius]